MICIASTRESPGGRKWVAPTAAGGTLELVFNSDGNYSLGELESGKWSEEAGTISITPVETRRYSVSGSTLTLGESTYTKN